MFGRTLLSLALSFQSDACAARPVASRSVAVIKIDRVARTIQAYDSSGNLMLSSRVGIGRGGLGCKRSMEDFVTPKGTFVVDIVLTDNESLSKVSGSLTAHYRKNSTYAPYLRSAKDLTRLFASMSSLDFDADGKPDSAYGGGYIGLDAADGAYAKNSTPGNTSGEPRIEKNEKDRRANASSCASCHSANVVTGPKASLYQGKVYWYSIALHGTPNPQKAIGAATSGGCVHLDSATLKRLLSLVSIGTRVDIFDGK